MVRYSDVLTIIIIAVPLAISWTEFLISEGGILDGIGKRIDVLQGYKVYAASKWHKLLTCSVCLSGQLSLWLYPIIYFNSYSFFSHLVAVTCSMVIASIIVNKLMA